MTTLFSISTMVSAGFVEEVFEEVCDMMTTSSYLSGDCGIGNHKLGNPKPAGTGWCDKHNKMCPASIATCSICNGTERSFTCGG